jgi:hypothetical protein
MDINVTKKTSYSAFKSVSRQMAGMLQSTRLRNTQEHNIHNYHHENLILIVTEEFADDLGSYLSWRKPTVPICDQQQTLFQLEIH